MTVSVNVIPGSEVGLIDKDAVRDIRLFAFDNTAVPFDIVVTGFTNERTNELAKDGRTNERSPHRYMTHIISFTCVSFC